MLVDDFVREEALHREALALGMDANDYVIKQRLIQSIQFITNGFVTAAVDVSDDDVADYYEANKDDYYVDPYVTFTHVSSVATGTAPSRLRPCRGEASSS